MKVILKERVRTLGNIGEMVSVTPGFARNFLIPRKLAVFADEGNQRFIDDQQKRLAKQIQDQKNLALELKKKLDAVEIVLEKKVGGNGKLFGAVTNAELSKELQKLNLEVEKRLIILENPIKQLGTFSVTAKLFSEVESTFQVKVEMTAEQIEENKKKQLAALEKKAKKAAQNEEEAKAESAEGEETTEEVEA